ncbi:putative FAD-dependent monooxygenase kojA [Cladobotryum mycophilum]|uniref:FAD-dependent monooxygenase kojA n=1 Tax=Cladobotryum mycophilum TaxID=491253 RepID=A0ABR0SS00_9HYPO
MLIAIVGAGWNGCHLACELSKEGHQVMLLDREHQIFNGTSGCFGIRLHRGPHYPRSKATRVNCQKGFERFRNRYANLVVEHEFSIYANGNVDSQNFPSKVSDETFKQVCMEYPGCREVDMATYGLAEAGCAYDLDEPSIAIGARARAHFEQELAEAGVGVVLGANVLSIRRLSAISGHGRPNTAIIFRRNRSAVATMFAHVVINCTGFQHFVPKDVFNPSSLVYFEYAYQACLALRYKDNAPSASNKPVSYICMDGWFPCLMPAVAGKNGDATSHRDYILTHGAFTILGSFNTVDKAKHILGTLTDEIVAKYVRQPAESEMCRFWPKFSSRFSYEGWYGTVLAKPKCPSEFRSSFAFENQGIIHVFPGKVSNVFDVSDEVMSLLQTRNTASAPLVLEAAGSRVVANGVFDTARTELRKKATEEDRNTCSLQTLEAVVASMKCETLGFGAECESRHLTRTTMTAGTCVTGIKLNRELRSRAMSLH